MMAAADDAPEAETYNPWSIVNLVFTHLADQGLHPILGESGDPGAPAAALLRALGIEPAAEGNREVVRGIRAHLDEIRAAMFEQDRPAVQRLRAEGSRLRLIVRPAAGPRLGFHGQRRTTDPQEGVG